MQPAQCTTNISTGEKFRPASSFT